MDVVARKDDLRRSITATLGTRSKEQLRVAGEHACGHIAKWRLAQPSLASSVALFSSFKDEISTAQIDQFFAQSGAHRAIATTDRDGATQYYSLAKGARLGENHVHHHEHVRLYQDPHHFGFDLMFVPGLAFDRWGQRLGRGFGCFDRVLSSLHQWPKRPILVGLALDEQIVAEVPTEKHDVSVDYLCTPHHGIFQIPSRVTHA